MYTLYHHPFCPHSRFIRLVLGEHGLDLRLVEERAWERREGFLVLNPAAATPVLIADGFPPILGDVPWHEDEAAKAWYARVKSRPSFRPLLSEWLAGVPASRTYVDLDF